MSAAKRFRSKRLFILALLLIAALLSWKFPSGFDPAPEGNRGTSVSSVRDGKYLLVTEAFQGQLHEVLVEGHGTVVKSLQDDNKGSRHQRFILQVASGQTILIAHNIDLAPRIPGISKGDVINFRGRYVYNAKGGIVHWTHHDPQGEQSGGWLVHNGRAYK